MRNRAKMLDDQNYCCAFCSRSFGLRTGETPCLHKESNTLVCRKCVMLVTQLSAAIRRLGSPAKVIDCITKFAHLVGLDIDPAADNPKLSIDEQGNTVDEWGNVVCENGNIIDTDGNIIGPDNKVIGSIHDGKD